jgi:hypothetical protein
MKKKKRGSVNGASDRLPPPALALTLAGTNPALVLVVRATKSVTAVLARNIVFQIALRNDQGNIIPTVSDYAKVTRGEGQRRDRGARRARQDKGRPGYR